MNPGVNIFRKKSLEYVSSPEHLTDYIKVSKPSVWLVLFATLLLLASAVVWSVFGSLPTTITVYAYVKTGSATCYVDGDAAVKLKPGMTVRIGDAVGTVSSVAGQPESSAELRVKYGSDYLEATLKAGDWNFAVTSAVAGVPDGLYKMMITLDSVTPISFLMN